MEGPIVRKIRYYRHSIKNPENNISPEGVVLAQKSIFPFEDGHFEIGFYGELIRTKQTLEAMIEAGRFFSPNFIIFQEPIVGVGNNSIFNQMKNYGFKVAIKNGASVIDALIANHTADTIYQWMRLAGSAVERMFVIMQAETCRAIAIGNDPMLSLAARYFGWEDAPSLRECGHIDFLMDDQRQITVNIP